MSEENKTVELKEKELEKVSGGGKSEAYEDCPQCKGKKTVMVIGSRGHILKSCTECGYRLTI